MGSDDDDDHDDNNDNDRPFAPQTALRSASNFANKCFGRFPTFDCGAAALLPRPSGRLTD